MLVNGEPAQCISIEDRGLLYGDGLFETILCDQGNPVLIDLHMQRLLDGCVRLHLPTPEESLLRQEIESVAATENCVIKVIITRGARARGYRFDHNDLTSNRIIYKSPCPQIPDEYYRKGIRLGLSEFKLTDNKALAGLKHLNRLEQVMACYQWPQECAEILMLNHHEQVIEGTMSNVFILTADGWKTPKLDYSGINGVMRQWLLTQSNDLNFLCAEENLTVKDLQQAQSLFVCNSVIGIWPVQQFLNQCYVMDDSLIELTANVQRRLSSHFISCTNG